MTPEPYLRVLNAPHVDAMNGIINLTVEWAGLPPDGSIATGLEVAAKIVRRIEQPSDDADEAEKLATERRRADILREMDSFIAEQQDGIEAGDPRLHHYYHPNIAKDLHDMSEEWEDLFPHVKSLAGSILAWLEEDGTEDIDIPEAYAEAGRSRAALDFKFFLHHVLNQPITAQDKSLINSLLRSITTGEYRQTYQFRSGSDVGREVDESTSEQQGGVVS